jgi:hypothetical protein
MPLSREEAKITAHARAELSLKHAFERIDHRHDVIAPRLAEYRAKQLDRKVKAELGTGEEDDGGQ